MSKKLISFDLEEMKRRSEYRFLIADLFMMGVVIFSLLVIIFNWHFQFNFVQVFFKTYFESFYQYYLPIYVDFLLYDSIFVILFTSELFVRWGIAIYQKTYHRWFWYPFIHWYDVVGSIPIGSFRFLRLLRVISITIRLQKLGIINIKKTYLYTIFNKYYEILVEAVADRVVLNVLSNVQEEIKEGSPVMENIVKDVIAPRQDVLVDWISHKVKLAVEHNYEMRKEFLREHIQDLVKKALENNEEVLDIRKIPLIGEPLIQKLEGAISGVTFNVIDGALLAMASEENKPIITETISTVFDSLLKEESDGQLNKITKEIVHEAIEVIKRDVKIEKWKVKEERLKQMKERAKSIKKIAQDKETDKQ